MQISTLDGGNDWKLAGARGISAGADDPVRAGRRLVFMWAYQII
jgi:hypothetical protein